MIKNIWEWLLTNIPWFFSGIGVVILLFLFQFISRRLKKRKLGPRFSKDQSLSEIPEGQPIKTPEIKPSSLTADAIMTAIKEAPLLQQPDILKYYTGLQVTWDGELASADKKGDDLVRLVILVKKEYGYMSVFVEISRSQYPSLGLLKHDHPIRVSGTISEIQKDYFKLKDARIEYELNPQHGQ